MIKRIMYNKEMVVYLLPLSRLYIVCGGCTLTYLVINRVSYKIFQDVICLQEVRLVAWGPTGERIIILSIDT